MLRIDESVASPPALRAKMVAHATDDISRGRLMMISRRHDYRRFAAFRGAILAWQ